MAGRARYAANRESERARGAAWAAAHPGYRREWQAANPEKVVAAQARYRAAHPERRRAATAKWRAANRESYETAQTLWREANGDRLRENVRTRRVRRAAISLVVVAELDHCGVCLGPLTAEVWPHPLSTTVGHEPPLARAAADGWRIVVERPEHWSCNQRKWAKLDCEMEAVA